jgi:hypothetical protein
LDFSEFMAQELSSDQLEKLNEAEKAEKESRLIPKGSYEGVISEIGEIKEAEMGVYAGKPMLRVTSELFNVGENMTTRKFSFNLSPYEILTEKGRLAGPYKLFGQLTKVTGTKNLKDALEYAQNNRLKYRIEVIKARSEGDNPNNFVAAISQVS